MSSDHPCAEGIRVFWPIFKEKVPKPRSSLCFSRLEAVRPEREGDPTSAAPPGAVVRSTPGVLELLLAGDENRQGSQKGEIMGCFWEQPDSFSTHLATI